MKKDKNLNFIAYVHIFLFLWAVAFLVSILCDKTTFILSIGNAAFLFFNIPFSIVSYILIAKGRLNKTHSVLTLVFSILNIAVSIAAWYLVYTLSKKFI